MADWPKPLQPLFEAAKLHGEESEAEHEVGDLMFLLGAAWEVMPPNVREKFLKHENVRELLDSWGDGTD